MLKCEWSCTENPGGEPVCFIERAFNIHSMYESKVDLSDSIHTFEALKKGAIACCAVDTNVPDILHIELNEAILQIKDHIYNIAKVELKSGTFYFKFDKADKLYLVHAAGIQASCVNSGYGEQEESLAAANPTGAHPVLKCVTKLAPT